MMISARARGALVALLMAGGVVAGPAVAQEDQATARALFDQGKALMGKGNYKEACPKLEAAAKLYSSAGILLNLADCYEKTGRTASAWTRFGEAASAASRAGREEQAREAKRRQDALTDRLTKLAVQVPKAVPGQVVLRNGSELPSGAWGIAVPVDPGDHEFESTAPGFRPWKRSVAVTSPGKTTTIEVPALEPEAPPPPPASATPPPPPPAASAAPPPPPAAPASAAPPPVTAPPPADEGGSMGTIGLVLVGVGVVGVGVSGFLGLQAKGDFDDAKAMTGPDRQTLSRDAVDQANLATVVFGLGAVAAATGVVLWTMADPAPPAGQEARRAPTPTLSVATGGSSLYLRGRF